MPYTFKYGDRPLDGISIQRAVGRGGFGEVYYALTDSGKQVAVKYLRENAEVELRGIAQVLNLKSPHLITIYDVRRDASGEPFVIMEYVSGPSLRELLLASPTGLGPQKAAFFLDGMAKGLSYLHERGIVHRDLKPGNIFYDDGYVKIGDYGLSKHIAVSAHSGNTVSVGTVHYMAPEIGSGSYTKAIDIYALGVMLYEMLTGRLPFTGSSMGEILMRHINDRPDMAGIPEPFRGVIVKALAKNPAERFQDVNEMADAVTSVAEVSAGMASFDPTTLTRVPRSPEAADDRTRTSPAHRVAVPPLDVRASGPLPPIPPIPDVFGTEKPGGGATQEGRERRGWFGRRRKAGREVHPEPHAAHCEIEQVVKPFVRARWPQLMIILMAAVALSVVGALVADEDVAGPAVGLLMIGSLVGLLLAHFKLVRRLLTPNRMIERFAYAAAALVFMVPGIAVCAEELKGRFETLPIPLAVTLVLFDWKQRIEDGRRHKIDGGSAFWHLVAGAVVGALFKTHPGMAALMCGALPIMVQAAAACWPVGIIAPPPGPKPPTPTPTKERSIGQVIGESAGDAMKEVGAAIKEARDGFVFQADIGRGARSADGAAAQSATAAAASAEPAAHSGPRAYAVALPAQASFVGRTANAGMSFLGKLMLLFGMTGAFLYGVDLQDPIVVDGEPVFMYQTGHVTLWERDAKKPHELSIPKPLVLLPFLGGMIFLAVARRCDGPMHWLRAFLACCVGVAAALVALGPASAELALFFGNQWDQIDFDPFNRSGTLLIVEGTLVALMLGLLWWPRKRAGGPIVI